MPVFARGMSTLGQKSFVRQSAVDIPLEIRPQYAFTLTAEEEASHFPSCIVRSGEDVIFCDSNGVIVLPVDKLEEIIEQAEKIVSQDEKVKGDSPPSRHTRTSLTRLRRPAQRHWSSRGPQKASGSRTKSVKSWSACEIICFYMFYLNIYTRSSHR